MVAVLRGVYEQVWFRRGVGVVAFFAVVHFFWPLRPGVVVQGMIIGGLTALIAFGIAFVYRANRVINFAQGDMGAAPAALAVLLIVGPQWPFGLAVLVGLAAAIALGFIVERLVVRRLAKAPRLIFTAATIGLALILSGIGVIMPQFFDLTVPPQSYPSPLDITFTIEPIRFGGNDLMAMMAIPLVIIGVTGLLRYTKLGLAIRATAESTDRASLLGVNVARVRIAVWILAAVLATIALVLRAGVIGLPIGSVLGPVVLLRALAAAVIGRMERLPTILVAAMALGIVETAIVFRSDPLLANPVIFLVLLGALAVQHRDRLTRFAEASAQRAVAEVRPVPPELAATSEVRWGRRTGAFILLALAVLAPLLLSEANTNRATGLAITFMVAVSLVVLTGWAGQVSLGQIAFLGVGAAVGGYLTAERGLDISIALLVAGLAGALLAVVIGIPALRVPGLLLAVATLAFAMATSSWLLNPTFNSWLPTGEIERTPFFGRIVLTSETRYYYFTLVILLLVLGMARSLRSGRAGRVLVATRENERAAQAFGVNTTRAKLTAFGFAGFFAALAGGLFVHHQQALGSSPYLPERSLQVFVIVVIGGLGSIPGAFLGATYVEGLSWSISLWPTSLRPMVGLMGSGLGLLLLILLLPGGLGSVLYGLRDRLLRWVAGRHAIHVPSLVADTLEPELLRSSRNGDQTEPIPATAKSPRPPSHKPAPRSALLEVEGLEVSYDDTQVLFGVDLAVEPGEVVALLGTNGAGKSTVLRAISGVVEARAGIVRFDGQRITGRPAHTIAGLGLVQAPGGSGVFPSLTVRENLRVASWLLTKPEGSDDPVRRATELFSELDRRLDEAAGNLSGGEQQMLTLAMALINRPKVLMIDELSLGLAPTLVQRLLKVVEEIRDQGTSIILVEQSVNVALTVADRAYFLEKGEVRFEGPTADLLNRPDVLRSVFLEGAASRGRYAPTKGRAAKRTANGTPALELIELERSYGGLLAVDALSLQIQPREIVGVIGPNGAGKTTLFDLASGFVPADRGHVLLHGEPVTHLGADVRARLGLGRSFQDARLFPGLTVDEAIAVGLEREVEVRDPLAIALGLSAAATSERETSARVDELIELMGLDAYRNKFVSELSTGTRRIVDLACVLGHDPSVILFDEPSSGIAQKEAEALGPLLRRIRDDTGAALLIIEHDIPLVTSIADRLVALDLGRVIAEGNPRRVVRDQRVVTSYLGTDGAAIGRSGDGRRPATRRRKTPGRSSSKKPVKT
jgi:ABC-type branched-subunit amino acid transport system ATPase component/ABC-type branched-subunit amino acid transport system permease subunit